MSAPKREKIKLSAFSNFMRNASDQEKSEFFTKVAQAAIEEERKLIAKAQSMSKVDIEQHDAERLETNE